MKPSVAINAAHTSVKIRKMVCKARRPGRNSTARIQTEKIHSRLTAVIYISANVQLRECGKAWESGHEPGTYAAHAEGCDGNPAFSVESVEGEDGWNQRAHDIWIDGPMREEKIVPSLLHDPWARW